MKGLKYYLFLLVFGVITLEAQVIDTVQIDKDALMLNNAGISSWANNNYGSSIGFQAGQWTNSGNATTQRSIFELDLSHIPTDAIITEVKLYLFGIGNHYPLSGSNAATIYEVENFSWTEAGITWNTQPSTPYDGIAATLEASDAGGTNDVDKNYVLDITSRIVANWDSGTYVTSYLYRLDNEQYYRRLNFCSSDHTDPTKRPYVVVKYIQVENYYRPQAKLDGGFALINGGELNLLIEERYAAQADDTLNLMVYDSTNTVIYQPSGISLSSGTNKFTLDLASSGAGFVSGRHYICEIRDKKGRKSFLRFRYKN